MRYLSRVPTSTQRSIPSHAGDIAALCQHSNSRSTPSASNLLRSSTSQGALILSYRSILKLETTRRGPRIFTSNMSTARRNSGPTSRLSRPLPEGTIDTHMHIIPPDFEKFPILSSAQYKPTPHTMSDATKFYSQTSGLDIKTPRCVLTQVSIYGKDNSALLSGLETLGDNGRGVVECNPEQVSVSQLEEWWSQGVRGIRINLVSVSRSVTEEELQQMLQSYVSKLSEMKMSNNEKWVIEMFIPLPYTTNLLNVLPKLQNAHDIRFVLDHFAGLKFKDDTADFGPDDDPSSIPGYPALVTLLTDKSLPEVYVKISAQYRVDASYPSPDSLKRLGVIGRDLIVKAENRVMWASDWPHTRFENVDSVPFVEACYEWCGEGEDGERRREKLFRGNAELVWGMK